MTHRSIKKRLSQASFLELNHLKERIRTIRVKNLITSHNRNQIFSLTQVDNIVGPAGDHMNSFNLVSRDLELYSLTDIDVPLLNQAMSNNKRLLL